jgi:hypothetical protein
LAAIKPDSPEGREKMKLIWMLAGIALTAGTIAHAEDEADVTKEKLVCRTEKLTGSRTKVRRICMTRAQWDEVAQQTKKGLDDFSRSASQPPPPKDPMAGMIPG